MKSAKTFLCLALLCPFFSFAQSNMETKDGDEQAILAVITEQTRAYFERDFEAWGNTHMQKDYYREFKYWEGWNDKVHTTIGWTENVDINKAQFDPKKPKSKWDSAKYVRSDVNIRVSGSGDMAWATFTQHAIDPKTQEVVGESYETRVMEKQNGQWKIAYLGYHYVPKEEEETN